MNVYIRMISFEKLGIHVNEISCVYLYIRLRECLYFLRKWVHGYDYLCNLLKSGTLLEKQF